MSELVFIVAGALDQPTGGYRYDARVVDGLRAAGHAVCVVELAGRFPVPDETARTALAEALADLESGACVVIDGLACGGLADIVEAQSPRLRLCVLVHHPLADETGLDTTTAQRLHDSETRVLHAAWRVVVTSAFTARRLRERAMTDRRIHVVEPGVDAAPIADADTASGTSGPLKLLCVASLVERKGYDVLVAALARIADRDWVCDCVGALDRNREYAQRITEQIDAAGLGGRVRLHGALSRAAIARAYANADLFVLASYYEGYGMVVTEALAHGLPVVTTTGGALADTLPPAAGVAVAPGDVSAFAAAIADLIDDDDYRGEKRAGARAARDRLGDWQHTAGAFAAALDLPANTADTP